MVNKSNFFSETYTFGDEGERETKRFRVESRLVGGRESTNFASRLLNTIVAPATGTLAVRLPIVQPANIMRTRRVRFAQTGRGSCISSRRMSVWLRERVCTQKSSRHVGTKRVQAPTYLMLDIESL